MIKWLIIGALVLIGCGIAVGYAVNGMHIVIDSRDTRDSYQQSIDDREDDYQQFKDLYDKARGVYHDVR